MKRKLFSGKNSMKTLEVALLLGGLMALVAPEAMAVGLPWESMLCKVATSFSGTVAKVFGVVAMVGAGILIAMGEVKGWIHHLLIAILGVSIAINAVSLLDMLGPAGSNVASQCSQSALGL